MKKTTNARLRPGPRYAQNIRQRAILRVLSKDPRPRKKLKIVDIGAGSGYITHLLKKLGYNCISVDLNDNVDVKADATNLPFKDNSFDYAIALHVLEHVICEHEIKRVLKPKGILIAEYPAINDWVLDILTDLNLINQGSDEHIRMVKSNKLPFKLKWKRKLGLFVSELAIFENLP